MSRLSHGKYLGFALFISLLLHVGLFALLIYLPQGGRQSGEEPIMVDLQDIPQTSQLPRDKERVKRQAESFQRVPRESAPRGDREQDRAAPASPPSAPRSRLVQPEKPAEQSRPQEQGESPFRAKEQTSPKLENLYPSAQKLAKIEEGYRRKYGEEVKENDTKFLNTDDILFGSFLRRFETAVYGVWHYPADAVKLGIEGVTPVRITFNRNGTIVKVELLESSGSRILDDEVRRTLGLIGPVGALPRGYDKEEFHLIAFFHYGIVSGASRGRLY